MPNIRPSLSCLTRSPYPVWNPSFSVAFRLLILVRVWSAMYNSVTADCDEGG